MHGFYSIGQVSSKLGLPPTTIRYWEKALVDLWRPKRSQGGQRRYTEDDVVFLKQVRLLTGDMSLRSIRSRFVKKQGLSKREDFDLTNKVVFITGGTGSFGKVFIQILLAHHKPHRVRIYSRDELKQFQLQQEMDDPRLRFFIGDVRDAHRLIRATRDVDVIIHAAAMKQVPACEYNPFEAVKTNILGAKNIIDAALANEVPRVIALSTDKSVSPVNLYGATKLCADKIFVHANAYAGDLPSRFSCVRYGNVLGSRGSVIPLFLNQRENGCITITDPRMTRFWLTLREAADLVIRALHIMRGGETFVPRIPSMKLTDLARAVAPDCEQRIVGVRPGEKIHEVLVNEEEGRHTEAFEDIYIVRPERAWKPEAGEIRGTPVGEDFIYTSNTNDHWLKVEDLQNLLRQDGLI